MVGCNEKVGKLSRAKVKNGKKKKERKKVEWVNQANERETHGARLVCKGDHNPSFPTSTRQLVPLCLWRIHIIEIGCESDSTHVDIVTRDTVTVTSGFVGAEITLERYFRVSRHVARNITHTLALDRNNVR
jgi:hypothetical protein